MKLRFHIRDLLWLAVVVALAAGWTLHYLSMREKLLKYRVVDKQALELQLIMLQKQNAELEDDKKWFLEQLKNSGK